MKPLIGKPFIFKNEEKPKNSLTLNILKLYNVEILG